MSWNRGKEKPYIDPWDVEILERWLHLAKTDGTRAIKIVAGEEPYTYKVTVHRDFYMPERR